MRWSAWPCPPPVWSSLAILELQEQFDIDHVQEEAETAIQEKAFELGKKAEKVTGLTGGSLGEATIRGISVHEPRKAPRKRYEHGMAISGGSFLILRQAQRILLVHPIWCPIIYPIWSPILYPKLHPNNTPYIVFFLITFSDAPVCYSSYCCLYIPDYIPSVRSFRGTILQVTQIFGWYIQIYINHHFGWFFHPKFGLS